MRVIFSGLLSAGLPEHVITSRRQVSAATASGVGYWHVICTAFIGAGRLWSLRQHADNAIAHRYPEMHGHSYYYKCLTPRGRMVKAGDEYLNAQGLSLRVSRIYKPQGSADVLVEFAPVDPALEGQCWQGEFLVPCSVSTAARGTYETDSCPRVYIEDMDGMVNVEDTNTEQDAVPESEDAHRRRDILPAGMS